MKVERLSVLVGGGSLGFGREEMPMEMMNENNLDLLICGEITEWTSVAYVRDAAALGFNKGMLVLGHAKTEEPGMKHLPAWMKDITPEIEVVFIDSKEPFKYI
jgi:putative NIF3 family GTP cyclohydrolase 1 type 2